MENQESRQLDDDPEALMYARYRTNRTKIVRKPKVQQPEQTPDNDSEASGASAFLEDNDNTNQTKSSDTPQQSKSNSESPKKSSKTTTKKSQKPRKEKAIEEDKESSEQTEEQMDRQALPRIQMSAHRILSDIPIRLDEEILARKKEGRKISLQNLVDELLHTGLEQCEKRRGNVESKSE